MGWEGEKEVRISKGIESEERNKLSFAVGTGGRESNMN